MSFNERKTFDFVVTKGGFFSPHYQARGGHIVAASEAHDSGRLN